MIPPAIDYAEVTGVTTDRSVSVGLAAFLPTKSNVVVTIFTILPIAIVFCVGTISLALVYLHVRKQDKAAERWRMTQTRNNALSGAVFWQFVFYTMSFLLCWPIFCVGVFWAIHLRENYMFWIAMVIMFPLQGFWSAVVYFRPHLFNHFQKKRQSAREQRQQQKGEQQAQPQQPQQQQHAPQQSSTFGNSSGTGSTGNDDLPLSEGEGLTGIEAARSINDSETGHG